MKNKRSLSLMLTFFTLVSSSFLINNNVKAQTIVTTTTVSQQGISQSPQPTSTLDSNGNLKPLKLTMAKVQAVPSIYSAKPMVTSSTATLMTATYIMPYSIIHTPLGDAEFLQQGCTDADSRANGWVSALQEDLNSLSSTYGIGINLTVDGVYGPATASSVRTFQSYIKNSWGCSTMSIDGVAGNQTWTAIYALFDGYNPHTYIS